MYGYLFSGSVAEQIPELLRVPSVRTITRPRKNAQRCLCSEGRALHTVVHVRVLEGRAASALHRGCVQDAGTQAVVEACLELQSSFSFLCGHVI
jgi:hypothetical protein